jgi:hypothetical protein
MSVVIGLLPFSYLKVAFADMTVLYIKYITVVYCQYDCCILHQIIAVYSRQEKVKSYSMTIIDKMNGMYVYFASKVYM